MITNQLWLPSSVDTYLFAQLNLEFFNGEIGRVLITIGKALLILVLGLILTSIVKGQLKKLLDKTDVDNKLAAWVTGEDESSFPIEEWISNIVGAIMTLFVLLAFLDVLDLQVVSQPLNALLETITAFLPRIGGAVLLLALAWVLGTIAKLLIGKSFKQFKIDERLNEQLRDENGDGVIDEADHITLADTIGNAVYWFIFLLFLPSILGVLELEGTLEPLELLVTDILSIVPNILGAILIGAVGWFVAQIIQKVVTNLLRATGINQIGEKFGLGAQGKGQSLSQVIGSVVYVLVLIPIVITALQALKIEAISVPATNMLEEVLIFLPKLFSALVILGLAYFAGEYVSELATNLLTSIGFDNVTTWLGLPETESTSDDSETEGVASKTQTPSQVVGVIVLVGVMLGGLYAAVGVLEVEELSEIVAFVLLLSGQVLAGVIIFAIGLYFANLVFRLIAESGTRQANLLAQAARVAILIFVAAMALERIGVAPNILNLAFGLLVGALAVAIALAFGFGGRKAAGRFLDEWLEKFKD